MYQIFIVIVLFIVNFSECNMVQNSVFAEKQHADLYWQALLEVAYGNKEAALKIVDAIRRDIPASITATWKDPKEDHIDAFFDKLFLDSVFHNAQMLSQLGLFESIGIYEHATELTDVSVQMLLKSFQDAQQNLAHLKSYPFEKLSEEQKISYKIFSWMLQHAVEGEKFLFHEYKINQLYGTPQELTPLFTQFHQLETLQDVENYIVRLGKIPQQFAQAQEYLEQQKDRGIVPPRFTVEKVITILRRTVEDAADKNIFYTHLQAQLTKLNLPNEHELLEKTRLVLEQDVYPAYHQLEEYFTQLRAVAQTNNGVWALPDGDEYYAYMLKYHTTTDLSADEIHELGLHEVAQIHRQMRQILKDENLNDPDKDVVVLVQELSKNPEFYFSNTPEGRNECLAGYQAILERSRKELGHLFSLKPRAGVTIQQVPQHEQDGARAAYYIVPSIDGSRPGTFFANLSLLDEMPKYGMETLTIHEAEPGHHFQFAVQYEMNIPILRKMGMHTAYAEGWALYAEKLAYEQDFYSSAFSKLGHLEDELLRAARLVVDTGIHHMRWTREQAIAYMQQAIGYKYGMASSEVERYFVMPGQACAYKVGQLKILELRKRAQEKLGAKFDIKEFHNVVLGVANVPLVVLEEVVDQYIAHKLA